MVELALRKQQTCKEYVKNMLFIHRQPQVKVAFHVLGALGRYDAILGIYWLVPRKAKILCHEKQVFMIGDDGKEYCL